MTSSPDSIITSDEKEILEELMNIAFGSASAELGEASGIRVSLSVPEIHIIDTKEIPVFLENILVKPSLQKQIVEKNFMGDFAGKSFLVFSADQASSFFGPTQNTATGGSPPLGAAPGELLLDIGTILIGSCIDKIAELLETGVSYSPASITSGIDDLISNLPRFDKSFPSAILLKTVFSFEKKNINGFLLVITSPDSITWLKRAIFNFMESYE